MKRFYLLFAISLAALVSFAQSSVVGDVEENAAEEPVGSNPITLNASFGMGATSTANHYIGTHECSGATIGVHADLGRFYKSWEDVSWNLSFDYVSSVDKVGSLESFAKTSSMKYSSTSLNYNSSYNWRFGNNFMVKAGGGVDFVFDMTEELGYRTNNAVSMNVLALLEASAGLSYVFQFKKWMLGLYGGLSVPFMGIAYSDSKHETGLPTDGLLNKYDSHLKGTSFSNLQGIDCDFGVKFIMKRVTLGVGIASNNRWWCVNDIQNYRKNTFFQVGLSFNLVSLKQTNTIHRYF